MAGVLSDIVARSGAFVAFCVQTMAALPAALFWPRAVVRQLHPMLLGSLPLAAVAGTALGVVAWLQLRGLLFTFRSEQLLPSALAVAVVWEFGPVSAGLIAAARIGAGLGAELGSMRASEQIDALEALAVSPLKRLVAPRVLACMFTLPLLTLFVDYVAILSSYAAEALGGTMSWTQYRLECLRYLRLPDAIAATLKTVIFGFCVGSAGCFWGLQAGTGTEGVGGASTRAVVWSMLLVLLSDVLLVRLIQLVLPPL